jgi:PncC family amidohydrolase
MLELKKILTDNNLKISVAESCTGGNLQAALTTFSGSSEYFEGGITCYTIDQKVKHLGVNRKVAESVDCVSQEVADQMALGCSKLFETQISISTTGYITDKLYYSICINNTIVEHKEMKLNWYSRRDNQINSSIEILNRLEKLLTELY